MCFQSAQILGEKAKKKNLRVGNPLPRTDTNFRDNDKTLKLLIENLQIDDNLDLILRMSRKKQRLIFRIE